MCVGSLKPPRRLRALVIRQSAHQRQPMTFAPEYIFATTKFIFVGSLTFVCTWSVPITATRVMSTQAFEPAGMASRLAMYVLPHHFLLAPSPLKQTCGCHLPERKPCLFMDGIGHTKSVPLMSSYPDTWGHIDQHAPCCSSITMARFESIERGWTHDDLQHDFCYAALAVSNHRSQPATNSTVVGKLILITHSMGNLIAAGAAATGKCTFTTDNLTWLVAGLVGYCPLQPAYASIQDIRTVDATLQQKYLAAQAIRRQFISRTMCGTSPAGLGTLGAVGMMAVASMAPFDSAENDGYVTWESCTAGLSDIDDTFGTDAETAVNYKAALNHLDTSFRNGDGKTNDKMPLRWFECTL
ncbi:Aste57867_8169 [Aphanomyces stellatus]|uniref:Aste57867_8169 protein n=1 Tax=Aphanomyces stellatus TaxID=120398 RepID=A0A485KJI5_9STRA|nr:hypothetical protein As57867_008139 [Aphanomyces stellatus]VFT85057.1 Aste57867_8169 [Aphanomyces stellatus]